MTILKILLIIVGTIFILFGYLIYIKEKYNLINGFEEAYKAGRKTKSYANRVGLVELIIGIILTLFGISMIIFK